MNLKHEYRAAVDNQNFARAAELRELMMAPTVVPDGARPIETGFSSYRLVCEEWVCYEDESGQPELYGWIERAWPVNSLESAERYAKKWMETLDVRNLRIQVAEAEWKDIDPPTKEEA